MAGHRAPPDTFFGIAKELGPGLIISANIVGSGELIVTTKLGADVSCSAGRRTTCCVELDVADYPHVHMFV